MKKCIRKDWEDFYDQDMFIVGTLFEMAELRDYNMNYFVSTYMNSYLREVMDNWHPQLSNGPVELLLNLCDKDLGPFPKEELEYPEGCMKWIGMMYAYLLFFTSLSSKEIYAELPFERMLEIYIVGHEMSFEKTAGRICNTL